MKIDGVEIEIDKVYDYFKNKIFDEEARII